MIIEIDLRSRMPQIRDQGDRPTCLAHAVTASHEVARGDCVMLSPEYLYYFASGGDYHRGLSMADAASALSEYGQPTEAECPYAEIVPPPDWIPPRDLVVYRRRSTVDQSGAGIIANAIYGRAAAVLGISLPEAFFFPRSPWVIDVGGPIVGMHAVVAAGIGRNGKELSIMIRNSWGCAWADGGYAWLTETFIDRHLKAVLIVGEEVSECH